MAKYKLRNTPQAPCFQPPAVIEDILDTERKIAIPKVLENSDYQEYLEWVAAGNTPEAAD